MRTAAVATDDAAQFMCEQHGRQRAPSASARGTSAAAPPPVWRTRAYHSAFLWANETRRRQLKHLTALLRDDVPIMATS